jgi:hypothetical protein
MATVPSPHQFAVGEAVTSTNINTYYSSLQFLLNPPIARLAKSANQTVAAGSFVPITFDVSSIDSYNGHSSGSTKYFAQVQGWYMVAANLQWPNSNVGIRDALIAKNGSSIPESNGTTSNPSNLTPGNPSATILVQLNVNDFIECWGFQNTGGNVSLGLGAISIIWMHV